MTTFKFVLILISFMVITSCGKESTSENVEGTITFELDGKQWKSSGIKTIANINTTLNRIGISAISDDDSGLVINLMGTTAKTYALTGTSQSAASFSESSTSPAISSNQGIDANAKVIISEINLKDSVISGTFNFTGFRLIDGKKINITNGKINKVKFNKPVSNAGNSFFKCKINGTQFNGSLLAGNSLTGDILLSASDKTGLPNVFLLLDKDIKVGQTNLDGFLNNYGQYNESGTLLYKSENGKVNITKIDKTNKLIEGTFEFNAKSMETSKTAKITDGSFSMKF